MPNAMHFIDAANRFVIVGVTFEIHPLAFFA